uniref:Uncharacterized protein LOC117350716 isoform X2 n=1 Tax=Geotrypetes seraphini TaxID=260995 RepID=A0A6P8PBG4_GEOSA|nr:uncharacterized protein LOC117350716 isoform X2 [Geotrypetes seraphini]
MPVETGMASNETNGEANRSTPAILESDEGARLVSLVSTGSGDIPQDEDKIKDVKDGPHERVEMKDSNKGSYAPVGFKENHYTDKGSKKIIDHALEFRETSDGLQIEMVSNVSNGGSHDLEGSNEGKDNHHMNMESQNIMGEVHHVTQFKETSEGSTNNMETQNICDEQLHDEEDNDTSRKLSLNVWCKEANISVIMEPKRSSNAPCSDTESKETNNRLTVCKQACDPNHTETGTTEASDETHHATKSENSTSILHVVRKSNETCDMSPDGAESDVNTDRSHNLTEVQDTCNKSPNDRDWVDDIDRSLTVEVPSSARGSSISTDILNTNSESCPFSAEDSDAEWQSLKRDLDSMQDEYHLLLEEPIQVKEKAGILGTREKPLGKEEQEEGVMCSSDELKEQLSFNHELEQDLFPSVESDGSRISLASRSDEINPFLYHCLLTTRDFQDFATASSKKSVAEHSDSSMCLQSPDSTSSNSKKETNLPKDLDNKSMNIMIHEMSGTDRPTAVKSTSSKILENKTDLEKTMEDLMEKDLTDSLFSSASGQATLQNQRSWSSDILPSGCLLPNGKDRTLVGTSDDMQMSSSFGTLDGKQPWHGKEFHDLLLQPSHEDIKDNQRGAEITDSDIIQQPGRDMEKDAQETQSQHDALLQQSHDDTEEDLGGGENTDNTIQQPGGDMEKDGQETESQHDPLLKQSHDDIKEVLGEEEITDNTIQQPGRDMEKDGQETQSLDMELPLEHNLHDCINTVLEEASEGRIDEIRGDSSTIGHSRAVTVSSEEKQGHLIVFSHEDKSFSSLTPEEALQEYSSVIQVTTSEDGSPASTAKTSGDSKELLPPHVESVNPVCVDLAIEDFSHHVFEVPRDPGDSAAPVVLNQANCDLIICHTNEGTAVGFQKMIINEDQSEQNQSTGEGVDEDSESICEGTITSTDLASICVDAPSIDMAHLVSDERPPTILEFFNPILFFGHCPEEPGQYDFQVQSPQPSYSVSITEQALNCSQTPLIEQGTSEDFSEHPHSGTRHNIHGSIWNSPHNSVTVMLTQKLDSFSLRQKADMDISVDSEMVSEESKVMTLKQSPAHEGSSLSLVNERTLSESLSNNETNVEPPLFTKTSKLLQFAPVSSKSKSLPQQAAVSDKPKPSFPEADAVTTDTASLAREPVCTQQPGITSDEGSKEEEDLSSSDPVTLREKNILDVSNSIKRRRSRLINSSRLLYQEYSDVVLTQEIQRQKRAENFTEDGEPSSPRMRRKPFSPQDSYLQRLSVSSNASLWQDIPMIRGSSVLLNMTRDEQKLQEAKFELIMSEASYLRSLNVAVDHFQHSPDLQALLTNQKRQWLFSKLQEVRDVSSNFLFDLEEKFEDDMYTFNVCDVVLSHAAVFRKVYLPYVTNQSYQDKTFQQLLTGNAKFRQVLERLESDPVCQRLSLKSFLILPFQRITRLKLLVQNILKRTQLGSNEEAEATQAHNVLEKLIKDCNENIQRMRSTEELIFLSQKIQFECKIFPLISQSRRLVKHGELLSLEYTTSLSFKLKLTPRPIYLHLFNDCLLLSRPREGGRFVVFDHARASKVRGERCEVKLHTAHKNTFRLFLLENNQGRKVEFLFRTETQSEKLRWISALSPVRKEKDLLECHDYPQVQCLKPYKARENDEISLEKADVIMVTQESNDGWLEGVRLSDGDRGWFPLSHVEEISSRHVRLRNLKEEQRIQNAKANLLPSHRK